MFLLLSTVFLISFTSFVFSRPRDQARWTKSGCRLAEQMSVIKTSQLECWCNQTGIIALLLVPSVDCLHNEPDHLRSLKSSSTSGFYDYEQQQLYRYGHYHPTSKPLNTELGISAFFNFFHLSHHFTLYVSLVVSVAFLLVTLGVQYRMRCFEQRELYFVLRNLVISLLLIELTFLFGTTFHMNLFWAHMTNWTSGRSTGNNLTQNQSWLAHAKHILCLSVPIFLHFIHLATLFWMFSFTILLFQRLWSSINNNQKANVKTENSQPSTAVEVLCKSTHEDNLAGAVSHRHRKRFLQQRSFNRTKKKFKLFGTRIVVGLFQWLWRVPRCFKPGNSIKTSTGLRKIDASDEGVPMKNFAHGLDKTDPSGNDQQQRPSLNTNSLLKHQKATLCLSGWRCEHFLAFSLGVPFVLVLVSYLLSPKGYETRK